MRRRRRWGRGQALVEFALVIPVFLLMLFGLIDGARLVYMNATVSNAAREGGRLAGVEASWIGQSGGDCVANETLITAANPGKHVCPADQATLLTHVTAAANRQLTPFGPATGVYMKCISKTAEDALEAGGATRTPSVGTSTTCSNHDPHDYITVRVTSSFTALTPIISNIIGTKTLEGNASFVIN